MNKENDILIAKDTFIVYGAESCPACKQAVTLLNQKNIPFVYKTFGKDYEISELIELGSTSRSIPQIFKVGEGNKLELVGSLMELVRELKNS